METINLKGKEYVTVNERLKEFRKNFKDYSLTTEIIELTPEVCTIKAVITDDKGVVRATGLAQELRQASFVNKTSYVENCETSAWGRALGNFGIGIDSSICTADELLMALNAQQKPEPKPQKPELSIDERCNAFINFITTAGWAQLNDDKIKTRYNNLCHDAGADKAEQLSRAWQCRLAAIAPLEGNNA